MNYRLTIGLVIVLAIVSVLAAVIVFNDDPGTPDRVKVRRDFLWTVDDDAIQLITIQHQGQEETFAKDRNRKWHFGTTAGEDVDQARWGGITLLLSGPQYKREFAGASENLVEDFGLTAPQTIITVNFRTGSIPPVEVRLGDRTPDGVNHYAQKDEDPDVFLIDATWGDALARLVTEPPYQPTPTPADDSG